MVLHQASSRILTPAPSKYGSSRISDGRGGCGNGARLHTSGHLRRLHSVVVERPIELRLPL
jgi:hypothetical protein